MRADRKWEEMFYQCCESLHYSGDGEPNAKKAWEQIAIIVTSCRNDNFQIKNSDIIFIFAQSVNYGYLLEPPHPGGSNEHPQSMFKSKNKKNNLLKKIVKLSIPL